LSFLVVFFYEALILLTLFALRSAPTHAIMKPKRWPILALATVLAVLSVTLPNHLGRHGGFLRARLVLLPLLLVPACFYVPSSEQGRRILRGTICMLLGLNLILVSRYFQAANGELREFSAAAKQIGTNRTLVMYRPRSVQRISDWHFHAGAYYCLESHNIDLRNYEAETAPWPIRFRAEFHQRWEYYPSTFHEENPVDAILVWDAESNLPAAVYELYRKVFAQGRLQVFVHR
jgi:hypothetical protein